jgi:hypothetical protein
MISVCAEDIVAIASNSAAAASSVSELIPSGTVELDVDDVYIYIADTKK